MLQEAVCVSEGGRTLRHRLLSCEFEPFPQAEAYCLKMSIVFHLSDPGIKLPRRKWGRWQRGKERYTPAPNVNSMKAFFFFFFKKPYQDALCLCL